MQYRGIANVLTTSVFSFSLPPFSLIRDLRKQNILKVTLVVVIGGFRSDLSITRKTDGNFGNVSEVFCFPKSRINENGGKFMFLQV